MSSRRVVDGRVPDRDRNLRGRAENARPRDRFGRPLPYGSPDQMPDREDPAEVVATIPEALDRVVELFAQQRFFEAHEFLEWIWKSDAVPVGDRNYWKGVTQIAVGFAHTQRSNAAGARTLLHRAQRYLAPYPSPYRGVDHDTLAAGANRVLEQIERLGPGPDLEFPRFPLSRGGPP
jgi:uncharacterized protein